MTCKLPVTAPLVCGANLTVMAAVLPEASVSGVTRPDALKPVPVTATWLMVTLTADGLLTVTVWLPDDPITKVPKAIELGLTVMEPVGAGVGEGLGVGVGVGEGVGTGVGDGVGVGVGAGLPPEYSYAPMS